MHEERYACVKYDGCSDHGASSAIMIPFSDSEKRVSDTTFYSMTVHQKSLDRLVCEINGIPLKFIHAYRHNPTTYYTRSFAFWIVELKTRAFWQKVSLMKLSGKLFLENRPQLTAYCWQDSYEVGEVLWRLRGSVKCQSPLNSWMTLCKPFRFKFFSEFA